MHFIACNYISGNLAELGIGMLLVMEKLIYDSKDTYQEAIHWVGQQSGFNNISPCISNLSPTKPNDLTIWNSETPAPKLQFSDKTLNANAEKQHPPLNPFSLFVSQSSPSFLTGESEL